MRFFAGLATEARLPFPVSLAGFSFLRLGSIFVSWFSVLLQQPEINRDGQRLQKKINISHTQKSNRCDRGLWTLCPFSLRHTPRVPASDAPS